MRTALSAMLIALIGTQACALTIPEGKYQLKWSPTMERTGDIRSFCCLYRLKDADGRTFTGAASDKALFADCERVLAVLDESKGTGSGYDVVYLIPNAPKSGQIDLKSAGNVRLSRGEGNSLVSDQDNPPVLDWVMGAPGAQVTKPMGFEIEVQRTKDESGKLVPDSIMARPMGGWYARVETDAGPVRLEPHDYNANNIYNDPPAAERGGDTVDIYSRKETRGNTQIDCDVVSPGVGLVDGKLYGVTISSAGDEVEFKAYKGDTGKIKVNATNAYGKPLLWHSVRLEGPVGRFDIDRKELAATAIPPGEYETSVWFYPTAKLMKNGSLSNSSSLWVDQKAKLRVEKDKTVALHVGGLITADVCEAGEEGKPTSSNTLVVRREKLEYIYVDFKVGGDRISGLGMDDDWRPAITVKDASGKVVRPSGMHDSVAGNYIEIPGKCPNGKYTIEVKLDMGSYQKPLYFKKSLQITD